LAVRRLILGVLGWDPRTMRHAATLTDIAEAIEGYRMAEDRISSPAVPPDADFLQQMMTTFPDEGQ
jgi:hypothetical protein